MLALPPQWRDHLASGVTHRIGSCSVDGRPGIARALAADVDADGRMLVLMARTAGPDVVAALDETGQVALVVAQPRTLRTLHLKGRDAVVRESRPCDEALLRARFDEVRAQMQRYGYTEDMLRTWYAMEPGELRCVKFTLTGAWNQTPGPGAGGPVELS